MAEGDDEMAESTDSDGSEDVTTTRDDADADSADGSTEERVSSTTEADAVDDEDQSGELDEDDSDADIDDEDTSEEGDEDDDTAPEDESESSDADNVETDDDETEGDEVESDEAEEEEADSEEPESEETDSEEPDGEETDNEEEEGEGDTSEEDDTDGSDGTADPETSGSAPVDDPAESGTSADGGFEGAPDDQEMPLTEHIEEMLKRLAAVVVVMGGVSLLIFPVAPDLINWLWYSYLPGSPEACASGTSDTSACPRVYHPLGLLFARIKVASLVGFVLALPVFVYQTYLFMRPGLYPHERRYYLAAVPTSLLLALVGLAFSYFLVLPFIFTYFLFYSEDVAEIAFGLTETFDLILLMMGMFAAIFQIPLFIMLAIMMGVTTRDWLEEKRYYFWLGFAGFAFLFSPDPTGMAPFMVGITMVALYELTLLLLRWTGR